MTRAALVSLSLASLAILFACSDKTTVVEQPAAAADSGSPSDTEDGGTTADAEPEPVAFALTSTAFEDGQPLPSKYTCDGANVSPPLSWTKGPDGTKSYTIVFVDTDNGLTHAAIYDIPADTTSLPEKVENAYEPANVPGAKQPKSYKTTVTGYAGPCPTGKHTYEWTLYAVDVDALPGTTEATTKDQIKTLVAQHDLASTKLTATYQR